MNVRVTFYGGLTERVGCRETQVTLETSDPVVDDVARRLVEVFPVLDGRLERIAFAVDDDIVGRDAPVGEDSEIALLPPVSGG